MKKINRLLSLILALAVVISSVTVFAVTDIPAKDIIDDIFRFDVGDFLGAEESTNDDPDVKRIEFLDSIGIWDDASIPKTALLTMTEFSEIMSRVKLGSENALLNVYGQDPDDTKVTYKNAFEYILHATGYYYRCAEFGNTDESLLIVAADIGLISANPENINAFITRGELARLLAQALTIDMCIMEYTSTGGYKYTIADGKNLLNTVHGIYDVGGFVNAIHGLAVYGGASLKKGYIQIERTNVNASGMDVSGYFGTRVDAYAFFDDVTDEYSLVYIAPAQDNNVLEIDFKDIADIRGNEISYVDENETELEVSVDNFVNIVENGRKLNSISEMSNFKTNDGKIVLVASARRGDYDTAIIYKYDYFVTDYVDMFEKRVGLKYGMKYNGLPYIQIDDKAINNIIVDGAEVDYTQIPVNRAIRVFACEDTEYLEIITEVQRPSGEVTIAYDDIIEVGGKNYRMSKNMLERIKECAKDDQMAYNDKIRMPELGANVTLYVYGDIIAGYTSGNDYQFAYLKSASLARTSIDPEMSLRVLTQDGSWLDLPLADKLTLDGVAGTSKTAVSEFVQANANTIVGELVRIKTNKDGKLTALDTIIETDAEAETTDDVAHVPDYVGGKVSVKLDWTYWNLPGTRYLLSSSAPVFVVPDDQSREDKYRVVSPSALDTAAAISLILYNPNDFLHIGAVVFHGEIGAAVSSDAALTWLHIENMRRIIIDKDKFEFGYRVMGKQYVNLRSKGNGVCQDASFTISDDVYENAKKNGNEFVVGDLIRFDSVKNEITSWSFEQGIERGTAKITMAPGVYDLGSIRGNDHELVVGYVEKIDAAEMLMKLDCGAAGMKVFSPRAKGIVDVGAKTTTNGTISDYHEDELVYAFCQGANASFIIKNVNAQ